MSFHEWYLPKKHFLDDCESGYFDCYEAGAASRQGEVDELKWMLKNSNGQADEFCRKSNELQKRIDESISLLQGKSIGEVYKAIHILKGKKDE